MKKNDLACALVVAATNREFTKVELLLAFGADPFFSNHKLHLTCLEAVVLADDLSIARLLFDCHADSDNSSQIVLFSALRKAEQKSQEMFQLVLQKCHEISMDWNCYFLHAVAQGSYQCAKISVEQGADMNRISDQGTTALSILTLNLQQTSAEQGRKIALLIKFLLENGADPSIKTRSGKTAGSYVGVRNIPKWLDGVTWDDLVQANAHKVIQKSVLQSPAENSASARKRRREDPEEVDCSRSARPPSTPPGKITG